MRIWWSWSAIIEEVFAALIRLAPVNFVSALDYTSFTLDVAVVVAFIVQARRQVFITVAQVVKRKVQRVSARDTAANFTSLTISHLAASVTIRPVVFSQS
jgi:hypothetical protein